MVKIEVLIKGNMTILTLEVTKLKLSVQLRILQLEDYAKAKKHLKNVKKAKFVHLGL